MSRILRRPMFRGGPVDSYGTGIASGLDKPKRGLVNEPGGYAGEKSGMDFLRNALLGPRFLDPNFQSPMKFKSGTGFGFMTPERQSPGLIKIGEGISERNPRFDTLGIDELSKPVTYGASQEADMKKSDLEMGEGDIDESETLSSDFYEKLIGQKVDDKPYEGGKPGSDMDSQEVPGVVKVGDIKEVNGDKEESVEYTIEDYIKMLGGDKAKRRDLSDMLASASASFLGTGGVKEGFAEFMSREAAKGPGRLEKIEQAAATLDIKDKIDSKRSKEKIELMKENTLFELRAKSDALKAAGDISKMNAGDALTYISKEIYRGQKDRSSSRVLKTFLDIKLNTDSNVKNVGDLTSFLNDAEEVSSLPEGITIVTSDQGKRVYLKRGDKVELVDINKL